MHSVDLSTIFQQVVNPALNELMEGLILAGVGWVGYFVKKYAPSFIASWFEAKASKDLNTALQNGAAIAMTQLQAWETAHKDVQVQGQISAWAAQYAVDHAPDAVARFGLNPDQLALKALAYIPAPPTVKDLTGQKPTAPVVVEVQALPPVTGSNP